VRIALVTDAWAPQVNGVVRTLGSLRAELNRLGHEVVVISPDRFRSLPCPTYPEIRLALAGRGAVGRALAAARPDAIHIATEGPLGHAARGWCLDHGLAFTTAFHTLFPDYVAARFGFPPGWSWAWLRRFHAPSAAVMVAAPSVERILREHGFQKLRRWSRGVDTGLFRPRPKAELTLPQPIFLTVSRLAVEKNLPAFLDLDLPGSKVVIGDGPIAGALQRRYPEVRFLGRLEGKALAAHYAAADVFVFPSRTDTFGLVLLEAMASGLPVAAYPVAGPVDVIGQSGAGAVDEDLRAAALAALEIPSAVCRAHAETYSWANSARQFLDNLHTTRAPALA
jgi:glycosyltransferase involved in cell wall biosynthesis